MTKQEKKSLLKKPAAIPGEKAPTGTGSSKADFLVSRFAYEFDGYDPIAELVALARDPKASINERKAIHTELAGYIYPKLKAIDTNPNQGEVISLNIVFPDENNQYPTLDCEKPKE